MEQGIKAWEAFKSTWAAPIDPAQVVFTDSPGHVREIVTTSNGYEIIAAVGGDGTVSEIISGIMDGPKHRPRLAVIPCGTGNDVAQNAGIFSVADAADALRAGASRAFDLIRVDRQEEHRYAFLFGNTGFTSIPKMRPWMKRLLGATGAYNLATFLQVLVYRPPHMTVTVDGREFSGKTFMVIAGNAERAGGGCMQISPGASTSDGKLNVTIIESRSIFKVLTKLFPSIAQGTHINEPGVSYITGHEIKVHSEPPACWISMVSYSAPPRPPFPSARWRWKSSVCKGELLTNADNDGADFQGLEIRHPAVKWSRQFLTAMHSSIVLFLDIVLWGLFCNIQHGSLLGFGVCAWHTLCIRADRDPIKELENEL